MKWWRGALGLERDGLKSDAVAPLPIAGRQDRDNLVTNRVSLQEYTDTGTGNALGLAATWACVNLLAGTIASLPLRVYRTSAAGTRTIARDHPLYWLLHDSPNYDQTALDFWEFMCAAIELHGNAYAEIERTGNKVVSLVPIRPDLVVARREGSEIRYRWTENGTVNDRSQDDILHIRGFGGGPLGGASTLSVCRQAFGAALATDRAANAVFTNGVRPSGIFSFEAAASPEKMEEARELVTRKYMGAVNQGLPMVLNHGVKWEQLSINPEDAQMLETRRFGIEEICRVFGVTAYKSGKSLTNTMH